MADNGSTVFLYEWTHIPTCPYAELLIIISGLNVWYGAFHSAELFYWTNEIQTFTAYGFCNVSSEEALLVSNMQNYWLNFVVYGNPNGKSLFTWPQFYTDLNNFMRLDTNLSVITDVGIPECNYWDSLTFPTATSNSPTTLITFSSSNTRSFTTQGNAAMSFSGNLSFISLILFVYLFY